MNGHVGTTIGPCLSSSTPHELEGDHEPDSICWALWCYNGLAWRRSLSPLFWTTWGQPHLDVSQNMYLVRLYISANSTTGLKFFSETGGSRLPGLSRVRVLGCCNQALASSSIILSSMALGFYSYTTGSNGAKPGEAQTSANHVATFPAFPHLPHSSCTLIFLGNLV